MEPIKIEITILAPVKKVWEYFTSPAHITRWNFANDLWRCPSADNDLKIDGQLKTRMEAKDGSFGFNLVGTYDEIIPYQKLKYHLEDGRNVEVRFDAVDSETTTVTEIFEPEAANAREMQRESWYAILNNFHKYVEKH